MSIDLTFLGTGTSAGIPMIGCHCEVCESDDPHDVRSRCSVIIARGEHRVLVDTTPEVRLQCVANQIDQIDAVVYTHAHADHIMGLDDVRRFNVMKQGPLDVWADERTHASLKQCFGYAFREPNPDAKVFRPHLVPRTIHGPFEISGMTFRPVPLMHGALPILGFRVGKLAYCTDVNHMPSASFDLLQDLDVLILDALQFKAHSTHFSIEQAIEVAQRVQAKTTYFTHIAHAVKHATVDPSLPPGIKLAYDGLQISAGE